jgi:hypothetical protein
MNLIAYARLHGARIIRKKLELGYDHFCHLKSGVLASQIRCFDFFLLEYCHDGVLNLFCRASALF